VGVSDQNEPSFLSLLKKYLLALLPIPYLPHHFRWFFSLSLVSDTLGASDSEPSLEVNINLPNQLLYDFAHLSQEKVKGDPCHRKIKRKEYSGREKII